MPVFGDGLQTRAFSHIADVAPVIAACPARAGVGQRGLQHRRRHAVHDPRARGGDRAGVRASRRASSICQPRNEVVHAFSDHAKVRADFDPSEPIDLRAGIERMAAWVREHGTREPIDFTGEIEVDRRLPPSWRVATGR